MKTDLGLLAFCAVLEAWLLLSSNPTLIDDLASLMTADRQIARDIIGVLSVTSSRKAQDTGTGSVSVAILSSYCSSQLVLKG